MAAHYYLEFDGRRLPITKTVVVGRSNISDVVLSHPTVSQVHCRILLEEGALALEDSASANGTSLNGVRIRGRLGLKAGDHILVGPYLLCVGADAAAQAQSAAATEQLPSFAIEVARLDAALAPDALDATAFQDTIQVAGRVLVLFAGNLGSQERRAELLDLVHKRQRDHVSQNLRPGQMVAALNTLFVEQRARATGVCVRLDAPERRLHCACAAHHAPWIARRDGRALAVESAPSLELGRLKSARYSMESFQLEPDECVVAVSDGLPQLLGGNTETGLQRIRELVGGSPTTPGAVAGRLRAALQRAATIQPTPASWAICLGLAGC